MSLKFTGMISMGFKKKALNLATTSLKSAIQCVAKDRTAAVCAHLSQALTPIVTQNTDSGSLKFFCPGTIPEWRARTLLTKEPETIEWINSFASNEVFWDIGANVGVYSLYAALLGIRCCAFEPAPGNHYILSRNIELNGFDDRIQSFCIAFNDESRLDSFYMANTDLGDAESSFGEARNFKGESFAPKFKQAMLGFTIDDFIRQFCPISPNHIKIDVDGIEKKIVKGAFETFSQKSVKSVLVELNIDLEECANVVDIMEEYGLTLVKREHAAMFDFGEFSSIYNHIFVRKG